MYKSVLQEPIKELKKRPEFKTSSICIPGTTSGQAQVVFLQYFDQQQGKGRPVAVKIFDTSVIYYSGLYDQSMPEKKKEILRQGKPKWTAREILHHLIGQAHPNIVEIIDCYFIGPPNYPQKYYIMVMEKGEMNLNQLICSFYPNGLKDEGLARSIFQQVVCAILFLHKQGIAHRDIKAENILLFKHPQYGDIIKLCDLGFSKSKYNSPARTQIGTMPYTSPEILTLREDQYNAWEVDVWCLGILLYYILTGCFPFGDLTDNESMATLSKKITSQDLDFNGCAFSWDARDLLSKMLDKNHRTRISIMEVFNHPWVQVNFHHSVAGLLDLMADPKKAVQIHQNYSVQQCKLRELFENNMRHQDLLVQMLSDNTQMDSVLSSGVLYTESQSS
eukprot:TRINITY_DN18014_c0_g2_i3.p1 TRINITY_DN18014_c0_g2~~TRINITY_DN18014_c0_g2_i3.p1  ORF type:complete len:454 (-),score=4.87 TRINITY_DN18014_c0_g2_i3:318-1487(-)